MTNCTDADGGFLGIGYSRRKSHVGIPLEAGPTQKIDSNSLSAGDDTQYG